MPAKNPWDAALEIFPLFGEQESLARQWLLKPYQLFDIQRTPDETLKQHHLCGIMEFALKHQKMQNFAKLLETLFPWMDAVEIQHPASGIYLGTVVLRYLVNGIEAEDVNLFIEKSNHYLSDQLRGKVMTLAQAFEKRGLEKGMTLAKQFEQRGIEKGRQEAMALVRQFEQRGVEIGRQQGVQQGMQQGEAILLTEQLEYRFGKLPNYSLELISQADTAQLLKWAKKVFEAKTLEDIFND